MFLFSLTFLNFKIKVKNIYYKELKLNSVLETCSIGKRVRLTIYTQYPFTVSSYFFFYSLPANVFIIFILLLTSEYK